MFHAGFTSRAGHAPACTRPRMASISRRITAAPATVEGRAMLVAQTTRRDVLELEIVAACSRPMRTSSDTDARERYAYGKPMLTAVGGHG